MGDEAKENCISSPCTKRKKLDEDIELFDECQPKASSESIEAVSQQHPADECSLQLQLGEPEPQLQLEHESHTGTTDSGGSQQSTDTGEQEKDVEAEIITLSDDDNESGSGIGNNRTENSSPSDSSGSNRTSHCKPSSPSSRTRRSSSTTSNHHRSSDHTKKLSDAEKAVRQLERLRKLEERRIKAEQLQAAKQLRKKEREALAEKRKMEREQAMKEKEEQRRLAMEKKKAEEEARRQREKEREEQKRIAQEKKKAEEEAKRQREKEREQRKKEEDEKKEQRRREEEERRERKRKEIEAEELRKKRESDRFLSFFSKVEQRPVITYAAVDAGGTEGGGGPALPFELKEGMRLAPIQRRDALSPNTYEHFLDAAAIQENADYLAHLRRRQTPSTKRNEMRAKLFQFHDNYRPPYYGTWRKRSESITGRRPFGKDAKIIDYDVDSDEEWEDEPDGEEIGDENNRSDESEDSDDENDGFFVEHGYLSDGEGSGNEAEIDDSGSVVHEDEAERKRRLQAVAEDWKNSMKQRSNKTKLIPVLYGPVFGDNRNGDPPHLRQFLRPICFFNYDN